MKHTIRQEKLQELQKEMLKMKTGVTVIPHGHVIHTRISLANAKTLNILLDRSKSGQIHPTAEAKLPQQFWPHTHLDSDDS